MRIAGVHCTSTNSTAIQSRSSVTEQQLPPPDLLPAPHAHTHTPIRTPPHSHRGRNRARMLQGFPLFFRGSSYPKVHTIGMHRAQTRPLMIAVMDLTTWHMAMESVHGLKWYAGMPEVHPWPTLTACLASTARFEKFCRTFVEAHVIMEKLQEDVERLKECLER